MILRAEGARTAMFLDAKYIYRSRGERGAIIEAVCEGYIEPGAVDKTDPLVIRVSIEGRAAYALNGRWLFRTRVGGAPIGGYYSRFVFDEARAGEARTDGAQSDEARSEYKKAGDAKAAGDAGQENENG